MGVTERITSPSPEGERLELELCKDYVGFLTALRFSQVHLVPINSALEVRFSPVSENLPRGIIPLLGPYDEQKLFPIYWQLYDKGLFKILLGRSPSTGVTFVNELVGQFCTPLTTKPFTFNGISINKPYLFKYSPFSLSSRVWEKDPLASFVFDVNADRIDVMSLPYLRSRLSFPVEIMRFLSQID